MKRNVIRLTESDLHNIIKESVIAILNESEIGRHSNMIGNFFNKFSRSESPYDAIPKGEAGKGIRYNPEKNKYEYRTPDGEIHDTKVSFNKNRVGYNWNPFGLGRSTRNNISRDDMNNAKTQLNTFSKVHKRDIDGEYQGRKEQEERRRSANSYSSNNSGFSYDSGYHGGTRQTNHTDQAGHKRAFFDDDASYDAGLR
jgi:hypothetical protein